MNFSCYVFTYSTVLTVTVAMLIVIEPNVRQSNVKVNSSICGKNNPTHHMYTVKKMLHFDVKRIPNFSFMVFAVATYKSHWKKVCSHFLGQFLSNLDK